mmetsp:Transcript_79468/g.199753  ORF Transcript_79468/g.199753 Transcript_79468/m.199753 type:complete len:253 (-) Transcript_79468:534-1292(-)
MVTKYVATSIVGLLVTAFRDSDHWFAKQAVPTTTCILCPCERLHIVHARLSSASQLTARAATTVIGAAQATVVDEGPQQTDGLKLSIALASGPATRELPTHQGNDHRGAAERRPRLVLLIGLKGPLPDRLANSQSPGEFLLEPVLNPHEGRLPLGHLQCLALCLIAGPISRRCRNLLGSYCRRLSIWREGILVPRALQVPENPACNVLHRCILSALCNSCKLVQNTKDRHLRLSAPTSFIQTRAPFWCRSSA